MQKLNATLTKASRSLLNLNKHSVQKPKDVSDDIDAVQSYFSITGDAIQEGADVAQSKIEENAGRLLNKISSWEENSKVLMKVLHKASEVHPFIKVAVLAFEAAITLELKRRDNDRKITLLYLQMADMMSALSLIVKLEDPGKLKDNSTIESRLSARMQSIANDIQECGNVCDRYQKTKLVVRVLQSVLWEPKFDSFVKTFSEHKKEINGDLQIYATLNIKKANENINMELLFRMVHSQEERELLEWVKDKGGPEKCIEDETLFRDLVMLHKEKKTSSKNSPYRAGAKANKELEEKIISTSDSLREDVDTLIKENRQIFDRKFDMQKAQLDDLKKTVQEEGQKVIKAVISGPHDRILDPNFQEVWKEMAWKGNVKARHFILALHDYYYYSDEPRRSSDSPDGAHEEIIRILSRDRWTLQYIDVERLQPLVEAFDDDASGFITVREANQFASSCPKDWSIPQWIAYWAAGEHVSLLSNKHRNRRLDASCIRKGFHINLAYYCDLIASNLRAMHKAKDTALPDNRMMINQYLVSETIVRVNELLAGVNKGRDDILRIDLNDKNLIERTIARTREEERRLKKNLEHIAFAIDGPDTLSLITGRGRIETFLIPLIYLLLDRHLRVMRLGQANVLHINELLSATNSLDKLFNVVKHRLNGLKAVFRHLNLDVDEQFRQFCHGMFTYYNGNHKELSNEIDEYYMRVRSPIRLPGFSMIRNSAEAQDNASLLTFGIQKDVLNTSGYSNALSIDPCEFHEAGNLEGTWHGFCKQSKEQNKQKTLTIRLLQTDGVLKGYDIGNPRTSVTVHCANREDGTTSVHFRRTSAGRFFFKRNSDEERYEGQLKDKTITGYWGKESTAWTRDLSISHLSEADCLGSFRIDAKPIEFFLHRPTDEVFKSNRIMALWTFARNATLYAVRIKLCSRAILLDRRKQRKEFIELCVRRMDDGLWFFDDGQRRLQDLERKLLSADVKFYRSIATSILRRRVIHLDALCNTCPPIDREPIRETRYVCLVCTTRLGNTSFDLCQSCVSQNSDAGKKLGHDAEHDLVQLRVRALYRPMILKAVQTLKATRALLKEKELSTQVKSKGRVHRRRFTQQTTQPTQKPALCVCCSATVTCPVWTCLVCKNGTFVCMKCNAHDEKEKPWLYEQGNKGARIFCCDAKHQDETKRIPQKKEHNWLHPLALCQQLNLPNPTDSSVETKLTRLEGRLADLETRLTANEEMRDNWRTQFEEMVRVKLDGIEKILRDTHKLSNINSDVALV